MYVCYNFISDSLLNLHKYNFYFNIHLVIMRCFKWCAIKFMECPVPLVYCKTSVQEGVVKDSNHLWLLDFLLLQQHPP